MSALFEASDVRFTDVFGDRRGAKRPPPWTRLTAGSPLQQDALDSWAQDGPLMFAKPSGQSNKLYPAEPTVEDIERMEQAGFVTPDPITFQRVQFVRSGDRC